MHAAWVIARKDLKLLLRDRVALFWVLGFPLVFALFFGTVMQGAMAERVRPLPVAWVAPPGDDAARALRAAVVKAGALTLQDSTLAAARESVRCGEHTGYVHVERATDPARGALTLTLGGDPSRRADTALVQSALAEALHTVQLGQQPSRAVLGPAPLRLVSVVPKDARPRSSFDLAFPAAILWGLMGCAATFAIALVSERTGGTFVRLRVAPISRAALLGGKALAAFVASLVTATLLIVIAWLGFGVVPHSAPSLAVAVLATSACFVGITMLLSVVGRSQQAVAGAGWATLLLFAMLGGAMLPLAVMPEWMVWASHLSPVKWGIFALEGALWRGFSASEMLAPVLVLLGFGVVGFALGLEVLSRSEAR
jgi:ABC-2 type transport system permease protein